MGDLNPESSEAPPPMTATEADILRWDAEIAALNQSLGVKEEEYIVALEERNREDALVLEEQIALIKTEQERLAGVLATKSKEHELRNSAGAALVSLTYTSRATKGLCFEDVALITARSVTRNKILGVTGSLIFSISSGQYLQILEGAHDCITSLFDTIKADKRHTDIVLLRQQRIDRRRFPEWPMYSLDLVDYDLPEQPLQTAFNILAQNNAIATKCTQVCMREVLQKGGNPHFIQPKRLKVVTLLVEMHHRSDYTELDINPCSISDVFNTFDDCVIRGVVLHGGTVVTSQAGLVHAQWENSQIVQAREAMQYIVDLFSEMRSISTLPEGPTAARLADLPSTARLGGDVPFGMSSHKKTTNSWGMSHLLPDVPLCALCYPCIAMTCGTVFMTVLSKHQSSVDVIGPSHSEASRMCRAGLAAGRQVVMSPVVKSRLDAYLKAHHLEEVKPENPKGVLDFYYTFKEVMPVPSDIRDSLMMLAAELTDQGGSHALPPEVLNSLNAEGAETATAERRNMRKEAEQKKDEGKKSAAMQMFHPPPPQSFSSRVCLSEVELHAQFDVIDIKRAGFVSCEQLLDYFDKFDSMGVDDIPKKICSFMKNKEHVTYEEFSIMMLKMAQD